MMTRENLSAAIFNQFLFKLNKVKPRATILMDNARLHSAKKV
jgi:hypothetical protein